MGMVAAEAFRDAESETSVWALRCRGVEEWNDFLLA